MNSEDVPVEPPGLVEDEETADSAPGRGLESTRFVGGAAVPVEDDDAFMDDDLVSSRLDFYRIYTLLGRGAMGRVYRAWNERLHRLCAVKVISPELVRAEPERLEMFQREARSAAQLNHPNIVNVHLLGHDRGYHFIEMEFINGPTLAAHLKEKGRLEAPVAVKLVRQIAAALHAAHSCNLLHCDVKPDNALLTSDGVVKLGDFGLARVLGGLQGGRQMIGTPFYMAPELFSNKGASVASDAYALGTTFYVLATGEMPFPARTMAELKDYLLFSEAPALAGRFSDVPERMCSLVRSLLAKNPLDRPPICQDLLVELETLIAILSPTSDLVTEAMRGTAVVWEETGRDRFSFTVPLAGGRHQRLQGEVIAGIDPTQPVMSFWTPCAPAAADHYQYVLELNSQLPYGAVSIRSWNGAAHFVMTSNHPRASLDPEEIQAAVLKMAEWADVIEHKLTGQDVF